MKDDTEKKAMENESTSNVNETDEERYIKETILDKRRKRMLGRLASVVFVVALAVVFGVVARVVFILSNDKVSEILGIDENKRSEVSVKEKTPTPIPTATPRITYPVVSPSWSKSPSPSVTPTAAPDATAAVMATHTPAPSPTVAATPTVGPTSAASPTDVPTATAAPGKTPTPAATPTDAPEPTVTPDPEVTSVAGGPEGTTTPVPTSEIAQGGDVTPTPDPEVTAELTPTPEPLDSPTPEPTGAAEYIEYLSKVMESAKEVAGMVSNIEVTSFGTDWFGEKYEIVTATTGLLLGQDGVDILILTDYASVGDSEKLMVSVGNTETAASLYSFDRDYGLAVISVSIDAVPEDVFHGLEYAIFKKADDIHTGMPVVALGNANGYENSIALGIVSSMGNTVPVRDGQVRFFTTDWPDYQGSSAFIFSLDGEVCGMVTHTFKNNPNDNITTCVTVDALKPVINKLLNGGKVSLFGIMGSDISEKVAAVVGTDEGIYVNEVLAASPAYQAGLKNGDIIFSINGKPIKGLEDLMETLATVQHGTSLEIGYFRMNKDGIASDRTTVIVTSK
ncbi:MAG: PDZ domain-containing protein [Lachnospiraceae bacterium]|nr:PDZ domain-containing protein [Lachnospiraceae bacterium]